MTDDQQQVAFARIEAKIETLAQVFGQRMDTFERDLNREVINADRDHEKFQKDTDALWSFVRGLDRSRQRAIGMAVGISLFFGGGAGFGASFLA